MQQSLQLLQAPVAELRQLVASELASNPVLEEESTEGDGKQVAEAAGERGSDSEENGTTFSLQDEWRDYLPQSSSGGTWSAADEERRNFLFESRVSRPTLRSFVLEQAAGFPDKELPLVELIAGSLDEDGYLRTSVSELAESAGVPEKQLESVLEKIRAFEPAGVGAHDLADCLLLQLARKGEGNSLAARILSHHLQQLARHRYEEIAKELRLPVHDVTAAARVIAAL
jgi:RNA polymerase sigma-54 factor